MKKAKRTLFIYIVGLIIALWTIAWFESCERDPVIVDPLVNAVTLFDMYPQLEGAWVTEIDSFQHPGYNPWHYRCTVWEFEKYNPVSTDPIFVGYEYIPTVYYKGIHSYITDTIYRRANNIRIIEHYDDLEIISVPTTFMRFKIDSESEEIRVNKIELPLQTEPPELIDYSVLNGKVYAGIDYRVYLYEQALLDANDTTLISRYLEFYPGTIDDKAYDCKDTHTSISATGRGNFHIYTMHYHLRTDLCTAEISDNDIITKYTLKYYNDPKYSRVFEYFPDEDIIKQDYVVDTGPPHEHPNGLMGVFVYYPYTGHVPIEGENEQPEEPVYPTL